MIQLLVEEEDVPRLGRDPRWCVTKLGSSFGIPITPFGYILHGAELIDYADNENVGWGFAIVRPGLLVLEELFVRPNWRMRGHGSQLADVFTQLAGRLGADLRAWIPHSDVGEENRSALTGILRHLGLSRTRSPVRWAAAAETLISVDSGDSDE